MKYLHIIIIALLFSCTENKEVSSIYREDLSKRKINMISKDSLEFGKSYLSVYSQIYSNTERKTINLTAMVSMRNTSELDTIYLLRAEYYDTHGKSIKKYFDSPIYLAPLETTEVIINELDVSGGTGSNFILEWKIPKKCPEPLFEGIMISTMGQQGLSFATQGKRIE